MEEFGLDTPTELSADSVKSETSIKVQAAATSPTADKQHSQADKAKTVPRDFVEDWEKVVMATRTGKRPTIRRSEGDRRADKDRKASVATFNKLERDQGYREKSTSKPELGTSE
jgi:hypothetical protein